MNLLDDLELRRRMSENSRELGDGFGAGRVDRPRLVVAGEPIGLGA